MRARFCMMALAGIGLWGCAGGGAAGAGASTDPEAKSFRFEKLRIDRPNGWIFVAPDSTVDADTLIILQGPVGEGTLAPVVEVSRRTLSAADRRRQPTHILTSAVTEIVQYFDGFEMVGSPEDATVGGKSGAHIRMRYTESLPDGASAERLASFYGVVDGENIWLLRFMGPPDGAADEDFTRILNSVRL